MPRHVGHYWPDYDAALTRTDPKPPTFVQYVSVAQGRASISGECHSAADRIAEGILRLAGIGAGGSDLRPSRYQHRQVMRLLENDTDARESYVELVAQYAVNAVALTRAAWEDSTGADVRAIAEAVAGTALRGSRVDEFLAWPEGLGADAARTAKTGRETNTYRHVRGGRQVNIRVGSIHSAKGETHTATLVLETYWYSHNLNDLVPWLSGSRLGGAGTGARQQTKLKTHYVAMTRPTHLLCLAVMQSTLDCHDGLAEVLESAGWLVKRLNCPEVSP